MPKRKIDKAALLARTRKSMAERTQSGGDPNEFRIPKAKSDEILEYYVAVLPGLMKGDTCNGGKECSADMPDGLWYYENGSHFVNRKRYECPRLHDDEHCPLCQEGFDLMQDSQDKDYKSKIAKEYLSRSNYAVNLYFLNHKKNPENLRGKVRWFNASKTIWSIWDNCINNDDPGDAEEPKPFGLFFEPYEETYIFKIIAAKKGEWNNYDQSKFLLTNGKGPLVALNKNKEPDDERIEAILAQRHYLPDVFAPRDIDALVKLRDAKQSHEGGRDGTEQITIDGRKSAADTNTEVTNTQAAPKRSSKTEPKVESNSDDDDDFNSGLIESSESTEKVEQGDLLSELDDPVDEPPKAAKTEPKKQTKKAEPKKEQPKKEPEEDLDADEQAQLDQLIGSLEEE